MADRMTKVEVDVTRLPRLEPLSYDEADDDARAVWDETLAGGATWTGHQQFLTLLRHPAAYRVQAPFTQYLKNSDLLPLRDRELTILRTGWNCGSDTQWYHHSEIGLECGLTQEEIDRIPQGPTAEGWSAHEAALLRACDELHSSCRLGDSTWAALSEVYDERQMIEFLLVCGSYRSLSYVQGTLGIKPFPGASPDIPGNHFLFAG